jgi:molecular chaperone GrpE
MLRHDNGNHIKQPQNEPHPGKVHVQAPDTKDRPEHNTIESRPIEERLEQLQAAAAEWEDKYVRLYAEMENSKKRLTRYYAGQLEQERERLLRDMLLVADNLERALAYANENQAEPGMRQGVELTLKVFSDTLVKYGVRPIKAQGQPFDPELHEAVGVLPNPVLPPHTVVRVEQTGYTIGDKLLRPALVMVTPG